MPYIPLSAVQSCPLDKTYLTYDNKFSIFFLYFIDVFKPDSVVLLSQFFTVILIVMCHPTGKKNTTDTI